MRGSPGRGSRRTWALGWALGTPRVALRQLCGAQWCLWGSYVSPVASSLSHFAKVPTRLEYSAGYVP